MGNSSSNYAGYEPQPLLLGDEELSSGEELLGSFRFVPCPWRIASDSTTQRPVDSGTASGVGHLTNIRLILFWKPEETLKAKLAEYGRKAADAAGQDSLGKLLEEIRNKASRSTEYMASNAEQHLNGVASWYFPPFPDDESNDQFLASTSDGILFVVENPTVGPVETLTFRPSLSDDGREKKADSKAEFVKLLKKVGIVPRIVDKVIYDRDGLVKEYK